MRFCSYRLQAGRTPPIYTLSQRASLEGQRKSRKVTPQPVCSHHYPIGKAAGHVHSHDVPDSPSRRFVRRGSNYVNISARPPLYRIILAIFCQPKASFLPCPGCHPAIVERVRSCVTAPSITRTVRTNRPTSAGSIWHHPRHPRPPFPPNF